MWLELHDGSYVQISQIVDIQVTVTGARDHFNVVACLSTGDWKVLVPGPMSRDQAAQAMKSFVTQFSNRFQQKIIIASSLR